MPISNSYLIALPLSIHTNVGLSIRPVTYSLLLAVQLISQQNKSARLSICKKFNSQALMPAEQD